MFFIKASIFRILSYESSACDRVSETAPRLAQRLQCMWNKPLGLQAKKRRWQSGDLDRKDHDDGLADQCLWQSDGWWREGGRNGRLDQAPWRRKLERHSASRWRALREHPLGPRMARAAHLAECVVDSCRV
ncbi:MAG: hypothetical protein V4582_01995 [Pseudomonadota bacterium]